MPVPQTPVTNRRSLLREDVHTRLTRAIVDGTLEPGEQLRDVEVATWLGVSRTPVREALLRLAEAGLVRATPGRSTVVAPIDETAIRHARSVIGAMHGLAVREAIPYLTTGDLAAMRAANARFGQALADGDVEAALTADEELHAIPVRVSGNTALLTVLDQFTPVVRRLERMHFASAEGHSSVALHEQLIDLCAAGDATAAVEVAHDIWHSLATTAS